MITLIQDSVKAVKGKIVHQKHTFELLGYDFILDELLNVILIEVNTNPCLEESNNLLRRVIPRMLDDLLNVVMDPIFNKGESEQQSRAMYRSKFPLSPDVFHLTGKSHHNSKQSENSRETADSSKNELQLSNFEEKEPHPGYKDHDNLWRHIYTMEI